MVEGESERGTFESNHEPNRCQISTRI